MANKTLIIELSLLSWKTQNVPHNLKSNDATKFAWSPHLAHIFKWSDQYPFFIIWNLPNDSVSTLKRTSFVGNALTQVEAHSTPSNSLYPHTMAHVQCKDTFIWERLLCIDLIPLFCLFKPRNVVCYHIFTSFLVLNLQVKLLNKKYPPNQSRLRVLLRL